MIPQDHNNAVISTGLHFLRAITEAYGSDQGMQLWETIADTLDPDVKGQIFFAMLTGTHNDTVVVRGIQLNGILGYNTLPLVSIDFNHDPRSSVFDSTQTRVSADGKLVKVLSWYDNEWGFSNRMLDTTVALMNAK